MGKIMNTTAVLLCTEKLPVFGDFEESHSGKATGHISHQGGSVLSKVIEIHEYLLKCQITVLRTYVL